MRPVPDKDRKPGVDAMRFVAMFLVVCGHSHPVLTPGPWNDVLMHLCRTAVPFFLAASGYFFGVSVRAGAAPSALTVKYLKRLFLIFAGWSLAYLVWNRLTSGEALPYDALTALRRGTAPHLWFFPALMIGAAFTGLFAGKRREKFMLPAAAALYLAGYALVHRTPFQAALPPDVAWGNSPFFPPLFLAAGYRLSGRPLPRASAGAALFAFGFALRLVESAAFPEFYGLGRPLDPDLGNYALAALPMGLGALLFALGTPSFGASFSLPALGRLSLGVYAVHWMFVGNYPYEGAFPDSSRALVRLFNPIYSTAAALAVSAVLARFAFTRRFVR